MAIFLDLFGRHVARRALDAADAGHAVEHVPAFRHRTKQVERVFFVVAIEDLRQAPVAEQHLAELTYLNIGWFDVEVHHVFGVSEGDRVTDAGEDAESFIQWEIVPSVLMIG